MVFFVLKENLMKDFDNPFPKMNNDPKRIFAARLLLKSVMWAFAIFGVLFIILLLVVFNLIKGEAQTVPAVPNSAVLTINFDEPLSERRPDDLLMEISEMPPVSFYDVVKAINVAAVDGRVKALAADINVSELGMAQIQDLREAIKNFRAQGKKTYIYSTGMGSYGGGTGEYYLASAFEQIWMQPNTDIGITGIGVEVPFAKEALKKFGITPQFFTRYEYKNAMASLMDNRFSPQHREEMEKLTGSLFNRFVLDVSVDRQIKPQKLVDLVNEAPILAQNGLNEQLLNIVAYKSDLIEEIKAETGNAELFPLKAYALEMREGYKNMPTIAFMVVEGEISGGKSSLNPFGNSVVGSETVVEQLQEIANSKDIAGLVLRINSPGGSYTASNEIWHAIKVIKEKKKIPVVVTMGDYAASGGYFIALAGDYIIAEPSTITGSIGVLGGKIVLEDLWRKLGVNWQGVNFGENAGILSTNHKFTAEEQAVFNRSLDNVYNDFTTQVMAARKISPEEINKIARGRIWTGEMAQGVKLVDGIGGINFALSKIRELAKLDQTKKFTVAYYPKRKSWAEKVNDVINSGPRISVQKILESSGLPLKDMQSLQRLRYDAALPPLKFVM